MNRLMTPEQFAKEINESDAYVVYENEGDVCDLCGKGDVGVVHLNTNNRMFCYTNKFTESWSDDPVSENTIVVGSSCFGKVKKLITKKAMK